MNKNTGQSTNFIILANAPLIILLLISGIYGHIEQQFNRAVLQQLILTVVKVATEFLKVFLTQIKIVHAKVFIIK